MNNKEHGREFGRGRERGFGRGRGRGFGRGRGRGSGRGFGRGRGRGRSGEVGVERGRGIGFGRSYNRRDIIKKKLEIDCLTTFPVLGEPKPKTTPILNWKDAAIKGSLVTSPVAVIKKPIRKKLTTIKKKSKEEIEIDEDDVFPVKGGYID